MESINAGRGRPETSDLPRHVQLREAKRIQHAREKAAGITTIEIRLPLKQAALLKAAQTMPTFAAALENFLYEMMVDIDAWPTLRELAWNRASRFIPAAEALALYERNWRHVDVLRL